VSNRAFGRIALLGFLTLTFVPGLAGAAPVISVTPSSHDFGRVNVGGTSGSFAFTVSNIGDATLVIVPPVTHSNPGAGFLVSFGSLSIPAGGSTLMSIAYSPSGSGLKSDIVTIPSNASNVASIVLQGTANNAPTFNPPLAADYSLCSNVAFSLIANATDSEGDALTWSISSVPALPTDATFDASTGSLHWTPTSCDVGNYSVTVMVTDGVTTTPGAFTLHVSPSCSAPALCGAPPGLVGWWTFDEPTGRDFDDIAGNHAGTSGTGHVVGKWGWGAVSLNGSSVEILSAATDELNLFTDYSFTAWIRMHSPIVSSSPNGHVIAMKGGPGGTNPGPGYDLRLNPTGKVFEVRLKDDTNSPRSLFTFPVLCDLDNGWHHVAVVMRRGTATCPGGVTLYIDGAFVQPSTIEAVPTGSFASALPLRIGAGGVTNTDGDIDEVMIFQRALTEPEVGALYDDPAKLLASCAARPSTQPPGVLCPAAPPQMVAWYAFDEVSGPTVGDAATGTAANWSDVPNDGQLKGAKRVAGKWGWGAVSLNQSSVEISSTDTDELNLWTDYSFTAWIRMHSPISFSPNGHVIAMKGGPGGNNPGPGYDLRLNPTARIFQVRLKDDVGSPTSLFTFPVPCDLDNGWHHVAVVMKRGTATCPGGVTLYLDGALAPPSSPIPAVPPGSFASKLPLRFGAGGVTNTDGDIDEVMIFQRALTEPEVGALYDDPAKLLASCAARPSTQPPGVLCPAPPPEMVAWYTFDEASGPTVGDAATGTAANWSDAPNDGQLKGAKRIPGKQGCGAVSLNGSSVEVTSTDKDELNLWTDYSFTAWVRMHSPISFSPNGHVIATKGGPGGNNPGPGYDLRVNPTARVLEARLKDDVGSPTSLFTFPIPCDLDNGWHHVAVVMKRGTATCPGGVTLYLDGALAPPSSPIPAVPPGSFASKLPLRFGAGGVTNTDGDIDEVMIFQRALTEPEVGALYGDPGNLLASCSARPSTGCDPALSATPCFQLVSGPEPARAPAALKVGESRTGVSPNPLNPQGVLSFSTTKPGHVRVQLFDLGGRLVKTLLEEHAMRPGQHEVRIDGRSSHGEPLASGVYFYRVETPEGVTRGRFVMLK
jgi:rubredoxin